MFWSTVVEPGAHFVITAPPSVIQLRITKALPYDSASFGRHRVFLDNYKAPPVLMCNSMDGCELDTNLSRSDLDKGPVLYQTNETCRWALSGVAVEDPTITSEQPVPARRATGDDTLAWAKEAVFLSALTLILSLANSVALFSKY